MVNEKRFSVFRQSNGDLFISWREAPAWTLSLCLELLYSVALWHGDQAALYRAITAHRGAAGARRCLTTDRGAEADPFCLFVCLFFNGIG